VCVPSAASETCNAVDDDCAGGVDDIVRAACTGPVPPSVDLNPDSGEPRFRGCPGLDLPGTTSCQEIDGMVQEVCDVTEGFCAWDSLGELVDGSTPGVNECVRGAGNCDLNGCLAGEWCCSIADDNNDPVCTRIGTINYRPPGLDDEGPWPLDCWEPDEPWVGSCPAPASCVDNDDCGACATASGCGWCVSAGQCLPGSALGADSADCGEPGVGWLQNPALCEGGCGDYFSCDSCQRNSECGFCTDTGSGSARCLPGGPSGPSGGLRCEGDWVRYGETCP
jgi:hypothetical protein